MIKGFHLSELRITGPSVEDAKLTFTDGLNVISGASDTGKSYAFDCIGYILGGSKPPKDISQAAKYDKLFLEVISSEGEKLTFSRDFKSSKIVYGKCSIDEFKSHKDLQELSSVHSSKTDNNISAVLLELINLRNKIIKEKKYSTRPVRLNDVLRFCMINENDIASNNSPILSVQYTEKTERRAFFDLLLSGKDDHEMDTTENPEIIKTRLKAQSDLVQKYIDEYEKDLIEINNLTKEIDINEIQAQIDELKESINESQKTVIKEEVKRNSLWNDLSTKKSRIMFLDELSHRFSILQKQYESDINRLEFIGESSHYINQLKTVPCPFCQTLISEEKFSEIEKASDSTTKEAIQKEMQKITIKIKDLGNTTLNIFDEKTQLTSEINKLEKEYHQVDEYIKQRLHPKSEIISAKLNDLINFKSKISNQGFIKAKLKEYQLEKQYFSEQLNSKAIKQKLKVLPEELYKNLADLIKERLISWKIVVDSVVFDFAELDFILNSEARVNHGKGVRAILYSSLMISLMEYCYKNETYHPGFILVDSPLTTFKPKDKKEGKTNEEIDSDIQINFFEELSTISKDMQIIIIDNKEPPSNVCKKINYQYFSGEKNVGRAGFYPI